MKPRNECECEHEFVLVLCDTPELTTEAEDALFEAGCDDATISVRSGRVFVPFPAHCPISKGRCSERNSECEEGEYRCRCTKS